MTGMGVVITAWSAISACGIGREAARDVRPRPSAVEEDPGGQAFLASDFETAQALGTKGTSSMDRSSALAIGVVGEVLSGIDVDSRTGVVLGTTSGSAQTQLEFTRDSLTRRKPYFVNPATMPYALMNSAAGQAAIWHKLMGPNTTIAGGRMSGLSVLRYAARLLAAGRASGVVCGAVEEYSPARAWLEHHRGGGRVLGEGAVALFVEPVGSDREPLAELLGIETRVAVDGDPAGALTECLSIVLARAGVEATDVNSLALSAPPGDLASAELAAARSALSGLKAVAENPAEVLGDVGAATGPFQIATLLRRPGLAVATAVDEDGTVGCCLLRVVSAS